jgi:hypothetical protein
MWADWQVTALEMGGNATDVVREHLSGNIVSSATREREIMEDIFSEQLSWGSPR